MTHTPGPWFYTSGAIWTTPNGPDDGGIPIGGSNRNTEQTTPCERDRNAQLMAAAPSLLEALRPLAAWAENERRHHEANGEPAEADYMARLAMEANRAIDKAVKL